MTEPTLVTATEMKLKSGEILRRVYQDKESFFVERGGYRIAAILPAEEYQQQKQQIANSNNKDKS